MYVIQKSVCAMSLIAIHRVFNPNTLCICMKYMVYIREIQKREDYFSISFPSLSNAFQME